MEESIIWKSNECPLKKGIIDRQAECVLLYTRETNHSIERVIHSACKGKIWYGLISQTDKKTNESRIILGLCETTTKLLQEKNFGYRQMYETDFPSIYDKNKKPKFAECPVKYLAQLTPTTDVQLLEWREIFAEEVKERTKRDAEERELSALKLGSIIRLSDGTELTKIRLEGWRRYIWYDGDMTYYHKHQLNSMDYRVIFKNE